MRISFVHDWEPPVEQELTWQDGLSAAVKELMNRGHEVQVVTVGDEMILDHPYFPIIFTREVKQTVKTFDPDVILMWADMTRPNAEPLKKLGKPMAVCFSGGDTNAKNSLLFDHIFVESAVYQQKMEDDGYTVSTAFGTNTDLFTPIPQAKVFDTIFPATFASWKRHNIYSEAVQGLKSLAVGWMYYDHETDCWMDCIKRGVTIMPHVSAQALQFLYAASKLCVITSNSQGGSQRTVLEAMAMNIPVIVTDSDKFDFAGERVYHCAPDPQEIRSYVDTLLDGIPDVNTRSYILENWSHIQYADALEKGLKSIV